MRNRREASCWSVDVVKGAGGLRRTSRFFNERYPISGAVKVRDNLVGSRLRPNFELFAAMGDEVRAERHRRIALGREQCRDAPILSGHEGGYLPLAIDDELYGDRLHAPGREPAAHLRPKQWGYLITDETVENATRLLRVDAIHVDLMRVLERRQRGSLGNLVQLDPLGIPRVSTTRRGAKLSPRLRGRDRSPNRRRSRSSRRFAAL